MKKWLACTAAVSALAISAFAMTSCDGKEKVMIYTSIEDYTIEMLQEKLDGQFPDYNIKIEYKSTSDIAAKVIQEGADSDCDIVFGEEYGYLEQMAEKNVIADLTSFGYDYSVFTDDAIATSAKKYLLPAVRTGGAVIVNTKVLSDRGLAEPATYQDLLDSKYDNLVSMPSPKSSGTGYMFYLALVNQMGESQAISYFDSLTPNVVQYTSSGSGPVNALVNREVAVGFGMITQAVEKINSGNTELKILSFAEGAPFNLYGNAIVTGKETRECVKNVMDYLYNTFTDECCARYYPEPVLKNKNYVVNNFPTNITYADMSGNTLAKKQDLLAKWTH